MPPIIDKNKCVRCGHCVQICPINVLFHSAEDRAVYVRYPNECWHCRACLIDCPKQAITMRYPLSHFVLHMEKDV
ncbi:MAG: ferredoxin family protein [Oscillospiraceae bacterium]